MPFTWNPPPELAVCCSPQLLVPVKFIPDTVIPKVPLNPPGAEFSTEPGWVVASMKRMCGLAHPKDRGTEVGTAAAAELPITMMAGLVPMAKAMTGLGSAPALHAAAASTRACRNVPVPALGAGSTPALSRSLVTR